VDIGLIGSGTAQGSVDDLATELAQAGFGWALTVAGQQRASVSVLCDSSGGSPFSCTNSQNFSDTIGISTGETVSVSLYVFALGSASASAVPGPATLALLAIGLAGLGAARWSRARHR
jgi:hypothetical protein